MGAPAGADPGRIVDVVAATIEIDDVARLLAQKRAESHSALLPAAFDGWPREEVEDFAAGLAIEAPSDERGGNRYADPNATAPHPDSTVCHERVDKYRSVDRGQDVDRLLF